MKVILTEDVKKVGKKGEIVELNDAFARNCVINKKLGLEATPANLNNLKLKKANDEKVAEQKLQEAKEFAKDLEKITVKTSIKCGENGKTFGSVSSKENGRRILHCPYHHGICGRQRPLYFCRY